MLTMMMYAASLATTSTKHSDIDKPNHSFPGGVPHIYFLFPESVGSSRRS